MYTKLDDLLDTLMRFMEARREYARKAENVEYDRGYFLSRERERVKEERDLVEERLNAIIDERVQHALNERESSLQ